MLKLITDEAALRRPCEPCKSVAEGTRVARELLKVLRANNRNADSLVGVGLAAPQVGILKRVAVILLNPTVPRVLVNPRIVEASENLLPWTEHCLSMPGQRVETWRHVWVKVESDNFREPFVVGPVGQPKFPHLHSSLREFKAKVLESVCYQHECAHLSSLLMTDFQEHRSWSEVLRTRQEVANASA